MVSGNKPPPQAAPLIPETPLPTGVGTGAGAGIIGPVAAAGSAAGLSPVAAFGAGLLAGGLEQLYQGSTDVVPGSPYGVPFGGPGLAEPGGRYLLKEWHIRMDSKQGDFSLQFYLTMTPSGRKRIFMYNTRTKAWKTWTPPRLSVIGKNMPSHRMITRLRHNLKRHSDDAKTILKLTNPAAYMKQLGYRKYSRKRR
jgi:hypothetical protein